MSVPSASRKMPQYQMAPTSGNSHMLKLAVPVA